MEQGNCRGEFRHRASDDYDFNPKKWAIGPHPIAQELRNQGKKETKNFSD
jgi:hypothetical protein